MTTRERVIEPVIAKDGPIHYTSVTSPPDDSSAVCYIVPGRVIPVGTVPLRSGRAPASTIRACTAFPGVDHEGAFKLDATRLFTLDAITRIAQSVKNTSLDYKA